MSTRGTVRRGDVSKGAPAHAHTLPGGRRPLHGDARSATRDGRRWTPRLPWTQPPLWTPLDANVEKAVPSERSRRVRGRPAAYVGRTSPPAPSPTPRDVGPSGSDDVPVHENVATRGLRTNDESRKREITRRARSAYDTFDKRMTRDRERARVSLTFPWRRHDGAR